MICDEKWEYITLISQLSDRYGNLIIDMFDKYNKNNTNSITKEEAKEYYLWLIGRRTPLDG